jgi:hypothetical protein
LNDLWKFDGTNWTWIAGASTFSQVGFYGTKGVAGATTGPGSRYFANAWVDGSGDLRMFGGRGFASIGGLVDLDDIWRFHP